MDTSAEAASNTDSPLEQFRKLIQTSNDRNFLMAVKYSDVIDLAARRLNDVSKSTSVPKAAPTAAASKGGRWIVDTSLCFVQSSEATLAAIHQKYGKSCAVLLFASRDSAGKPWCPDCVAAEPPLRRALASSDPAATIVEVPLTREAWRGPHGKDNKWRKPPFNVGGIPTLLEVRDGKVVAQLPEEDCLVDQKVKQCLARQV